MSAIATLYHDVGKRIARTARNVRDMQRTPAILAMLVKDLYAIDGAHRASSVFEARISEIADADVEPIRTTLARIDALETRVRTNDAAAVDEAIALALEVEAAIATWLVRAAGARE
jgi:hypothetical protein